MRRFVVTKLVACALLGAVAACGGGPAAPECKVGGDACTAAAGCCSAGCCSSDRGLVCSAAGHMCINAYGLPIGERCDGTIAARTQCASQMCSPRGYCGRSCATDDDCSNAPGQFVNMICVFDKYGGSMPGNYCAPVCTANSDCSDYPGAICTQTTTSDGSTTVNACL